MLPGCLCNACNMPRFHKQLKEALHLQYGTTTACQIVGLAIPHRAEPMSTCGCTVNTRQALENNASHPSSLEFPKTRSPFRSVLYLGRWRKN